MLRALLIAVLFAAPGRAETLEWRDGPGPVHPVVLEEQRATLTLGPEHTVEARIDGGRVLVGTVTYPLDADVNGWRFHRDGEQLFLRGPRRMAGSIVLAKRARPVSFLGNTLLLDLDGDGELTAEEVVAPGTPFRCGTGAFFATFDRNTRVLEVHKAQRVPPRRQRTWVPATPPRAPTWVIWTEAVDPLPKLISLYRKERKKRRRERFPDVFVKRYLYQIGLTGSPRAFRFLWQVYERDNNTRVRAAAVEAMGFPAHVNHAKSLIRIARGPADSRPSEIFGSAPTFKIHAAAVESLHYMAAPGRGDLYRELLDRIDDRELAGACARCLGYLGTQEAQDVLAALSRQRLSENARGGGPDLDDLYRGVRCGPRAPELAWMLAVRDDAFTRDEVLRDLLVLGYTDEARRQALALAARKRGVWLDEEKLRVAAVLAAAADATAVRAALAPPLFRARKPLRRLLPGVRDPLALRVMIDGLDGPASSLLIDVLGGIPVPAVTKALLDRLKTSPAPALIEALSHHGAAARPALLALARGGNFPATLALVETGGDAALAVTLRTSQAWRERIAGLRLAKPATEDVAKGLADDRWQVRLAALAHAGAEAARARLEDAAETRRVRRAAAQRLGIYAAPKPAAEIAGIALDTDRVLFLVDTSGSMEEEHLARALADLRATTDALPAGTRANIVLMGDRAKVWKPAAVVLERGTRIALRRFLRRAKPGEKRGDLAAALRLAFADEGIDTVVILASHYIDLRFSPAVAQVRTLDPTRSVTIHGVAVGGDSDLLRELAERHGGRYVAR